MSSREIRISSFAQLFDTIKEYQRTTNWIFRGHARSSWKLIPKAGRPLFLGADDLDFFTRWKRQAVSLVAAQPSNEWDWLAIAQHHGLATRLLDWTFKPLAAIYFALAGELDDDAVVYAFHSLWAVDEDAAPGDVKGIARVTPSALAQRITTQGALFTVHGPPHLDLEDHLAAGEELHRLVIDRRHRRKLLFDLAYCGVNAYTWFPDLDGLSEWLNWHWATLPSWEELSGVGEGAQPL